MTCILHRGRRRAFVPALLASIVVSAIWTGLSAQTGRQFYASPTGLPSNNGSIASPLDLSTALSSTGPVRAGDTVWLRGGVYRRASSLDSHGDPVVYVSTLNGTAAAPILVRQYPGERATLDGNLAPSVPVLVVYGSYTYYWGFEITNSHPNRSSTRGDGIDTYGHHNRFINLIIHDTGQGVGFWATGQADDSEIYGSVISHVGHEGGDRGHGHSIYVQNVNGAKRIADNILFESFSFGIHAYTVNGRIDNLTMTGNIAFNHGNLSPSAGPKANILFAGDQVAQNPSVVGNYAYYPAGSAGRGLDVNQCNNGRLQNNYLAGGTPLRLASCTNTLVTGNTMFGPVAGATQAAYPSNTYGTTPSGVWVGIRPNTYEPGRANIAIFNWARHGAVSVDIAAALAVGAQYEVRDAQNFFGPPVASGVYGGGSITIPMTGLTAAPVIGNAPIQPGHTSAEFGAFVLLPLGVAPPPPPPPAPPPPPGPPAPPPPPAPPAAPRIDSVTPHTGQALGGLAVTLTGAGFVSPATVLVGGTPATAVVVPNSSTLSMIVPPHTPGVVDVVVTTAGQQVVRASAFTYEPMAPVLHPVTITGDQVSLQWQAGPGTPVRAYGVVAGHSPGATHFGPYLLGLGNSLSATVGPGTYYARVLADTAWGVLTSNEVGFVVGLPGLPSPPTLAPASISGQTVSLSWTAVAGSGGYVVVARSTAAGPPIATLPVAGTALSIAAPPGVYLVSVVAVNGYGVGAESNQIVVTVP